MSTREQPRKNSGRALAEQGAKKEKRTTFFERHTEPDIPVEGVESIIDVPEAIREAVDLKGYFQDRIWYQPLVVRPDENGMSLVSYRFAPNHVTPRHYHDTDQIVFVLEGELHFGNRILRPGDGYFTKAGTRYSITAGPNGCRLMEFRNVTEYQTIFVEDDPERWGTHDGKSG